MYRSILVPLDGTAYGEHAVPIARGIARRCGAALHLVHVHADPALPAAVESLPYLGTRDIGETLEEERSYLADLAERLQEEQLKVVCEVVRGPLTESLERYAIERNADLVVACTHAHEGLSRFWHRGVGEQILHDISIPCLLLRPTDTEPDLASERVFRHVLMPLSGSPFAEEILEKAVTLGKAVGARFTLLSVVRPMMIVGYTLLAQDAHVNHFLLEEQQRESEAYLARVAERLRAAGLQVATRVVAAEEVAGAIVEATRPGATPELPPVDLIAMTTHSRGTLSRVVVSSVTDEVLHHSPVPLLLHHPHAVEAEESLANPRRAVQNEDLVERRA